MKRVLASLGIAGAFALGACGAGTPVLVKPVAVRTDLAPATLPGFSFTEYTGARASFAHVGASSLVADGRLWQVRRGAALVGTLQISTVKPDVSVSKASDRTAILDGVMTGTSYETIDISGITVATSTTVDKSLYLWFGPGYFEVMQLKGSQLDPESVVTALIGYQQANAGLVAVAAPGDQNGP